MAVITNTNTTIPIKHLFERGDANWSRPYSFVPFPNYDGLARLRQAERKVAALKHLGNATRLTKKQTYVNLARGRDLYGRKRTYASKSDRGTNYNTRNYLHINGKTGEILNDVGTAPPRTYQPFGTIPLHSHTHEQASCILVPPIRTVHAAEETPAYTVAVEPPSASVPLQSEHGILLATPAPAPDAIPSTNVQRYVFKAINGREIAPVVSPWTPSQDDMAHGDVMDLVLGRTTVEKTDIYLDSATMQHYTTVENPPRPTWGSSTITRHYLTDEYAAAYFGRHGSSIIPGVDIDVTWWMGGQTTRIIDLVSLRQFRYGNPHGTENFSIIYS